MTNKIPKTAQVYFFLTPDETAGVLKFITSQGCRVFVDRSETSAPKEVSRLFDLGQVFFCPAAYVPRIEMLKTAAGIYYLDSMGSPVIELDCCVKRNLLISRGRMFFRGGYIGRDGWVPFPEQLYESYKKTKQFIQKSFLIQEKKYGASLSKASLEFLAQGGQLSQF